MYKVVVRRRSDNEVVDVFECGNYYRYAERVEKGININLNKDEYKTEIIEG